MSKSNLDLDKARQVAIKAALKGREILIDHFGKLTKVSEKEQAGLVSEADLESEKAIIAILKSEFSEFLILGEETSHQTPGQSLDPEARKRGVWIIDPLDGTTNYVHQLPIYCVSIGLEVNHELVVGVCDVPVFQKTYHAARGLGAYVGDRRLQVSDRKLASQALLATGFSSYDKSALRSQLQIFGDIVGEVRGVRRAGSAVYDLCMVAEGVFDAYWERNLSPWDTAAGALMVLEAGGVVTNYESSNYSVFDKTIIAGNPHLHAHVQKRIREYQKSI
jgi:myo-inositol-1(or 4)-monophosphatase